MNLASLSTPTRSVLVAAGLACGLAFAAPVQAADNVQFGFSIGSGDSGFSFSLGNGGYIGRHFAPPQAAPQAAPRPAPQPVCMTENQMRTQLRAQGYRWIGFGNAFRGWVHVTARRMGQGYQFDMNRCTGVISNLVATGGYGGGYDGGFGNGPAPGGFGGGYSGGYTGGFGGFR